MKNPDDIQKFGKWLKLIREKRGFTQASLAFDAGISGRTIQKIEAGEQAVTVDIIFSISRALQIQPVEIFKGFSIEIEE